MFHLADFRLQILLFDLVNAQRVQRLRIHMRRFHCPAHRLRQHDRLCGRCGHRLRLTLLYVGEIIAQQLFQLLRQLRLQIDGIILPHIHGFDKKV